MTDHGYTYVVLVHRASEEDDFGPHATEHDAILQLRNELQEGWDAVGIGGNFLITTRYEDTQDFFWGKWRKEEARAVSSSPLTCAASDCGTEVTPDPTTANQRYCSQRCRHRVKMREYRASEEGS